MAKNHLKKNQLYSTIIETDWLIYSQRGNKMKIYDTNSIRNVALIGHGGEGKTSLAEAMMFDGKAIDRLGRVDDGNATMDFDQEEIARKISIGMGLGYTEWKGTKINILDTPGSFDFEGEVVAALHVADGAVIVTSANGSLSVGCEKAIEMIGERKLPAILFVNAVTKENANYIETISAIRERYKKVVSAEIPVVENYKMTGIVSVLDGKAFDMNGNEMPIPAAYKDAFEEARLELVEMAAETSDELMEKYFEDGDLSEEDVLQGIRVAVENASVILAFGGSATQNVGITNLMDRIVSILPAPAVKQDVASLQVFKTIVDPFVGKLLMFKVMGGTINSGDILLNANNDKQERISSIYCIRGKKQDAVDKFNAGDIGAVAKLGYTKTCDTLCDPANKVVLDPIPFPVPTISLAVNAVKKDDEEKVISAVYKVLDEESTARIEKNAETNETLLQGLGETQLDIIIKKVKNKYGLDAILREPRVSYRETIRRSAEATGRHKKQNGGSGQFGQCSVRFEPGAEDGVFEFVDAVVGGAIPRQYIPAVEKGLREAIKQGVLAGYPLINVKATVFDGKYHPVDSKEIAFISAAKLAYDEGINAAGPYFLEPIMDVKIIVPSSYLGDVLGDISKRRGAIKFTEEVNGKQIISASVPQAEMLKYATDLRSMTQGRGKFTMEFAEYQEVPASNNDKIIEDAKKRRAELDARK